MKKQEIQKKEAGKNSKDKENSRNKLTENTLSTDSKGLERPQTDKALRERNKLGNKVTRGR